jgi:dTDP-glucose 4,6-dehydratase
VVAAAERGEPGRVYNIGASSERPNLEIVKEILRLVGKPESLIKFVTDRPGHDRRYAIDSTRIREELGWAPRRNLTEALEDTVRWYLENDAWCAEVRSGEHQTFFERWYGGRLGDDA